MFCTNVSLHPWKPWCLCSAAIMIVLPLHPTQIVVVTSSAFHTYIDFRESAGRKIPPDRHANFAKCSVLERYVRLLVPASAS
ncbi:hypothetical protein B0H21DRAFT_772966, partial [Amylocystis lapponica]